MKNKYKNNSQRELVFRLHGCTEDDTIFLAIMCIILRGDSSALVLVAPGRIYFTPRLLHQKNSRMCIILLSTAIAGILLPT